MGGDHLTMWNESETGRISCETIFKFLTLRMFVRNEKFVTGARPSAKHLERAGVPTTDPVIHLLPGVSPDGWWRFGVVADDIRWPDYYDLAPNVLAPGEQAAATRRRHSLGKFGFIPDFVDVIKFNPRNPRRFRLMLGDGHTQWLGRGNLWPENRVLRLASDPLDWLRIIGMGQEAVCFIGEDYDAFRHGVEYGVDRIVCSDVQHASRAYKWARYEVARKIPAVTYETGETNVTTETAEAVR